MENHPTPSPPNILKNKTPSEMNRIIIVDSSSPHDHVEVIQHQQATQHDRKQLHNTQQSVPYCKLYTFADRYDIVMILLGIIGGVANGASMPLSSILFGDLIDAFGKNATDTDRVVHKVSMVALRFVYLGAGAAVASFAQVACWMITGERQAARIRTFYLKAILRQEIAFFDKETSTGEVVGRMSGDTILIQDAMGEKVGKFLQLISTFIGGFIVAFVKGWKLTLVLIATIPLLVGAGGVMAILIAKATNRGQEAYAEAGAVVEQVIGAIRTVVSFTGERKAVEDYDKALKRAYKASIEQGLASGFGLGFAMAIVFSTYGLALWYGSKLVIHHGYTGGSILNVIFAVLMGGMSLGQASPSINAFAAGQAAAYKMFEVIYRVPQIDVSRTNGSILDNIQGDIKFEDVDFAYPARPDVQIFSKLSLNISKGITAALVGESGSGKSTVVSLIERFYDPQGGRIMLDGIDIRDLQLKWLRQQIGLVSQEPVLFGTSIYENILYGKDGATFDEVKSAAELANAAKFIQAMPQGYDTLVGEHGTQLSGGQKQRVAIARAIIKNPHILLLDEATSALDAESEHLVQEALEQVMLDRTTLVIAHRLTTIRNVDCIAVLQHGAIVETGSHDELIRRPNGAFSQLVHLQQMQKERALEEKTGSSVISSVESPWTFIRTGSSRSLSRSMNVSLGGSRHSLSSNRSDSARAVANIESQSYKKRIMFLQCFCTRQVHDLETGEQNTCTEVSIIRLASLNKPEIPILIVGSLAAIIHGVIFPMFGILISNIIKAFYDSHHKLRKDSNFWASMFMVLAAACFIVMPTQIICFAIGGSRLIQRVRLLAFKKLLQQEVSWFDESENSSGALSARLFTDAAQVRSMVGDALALAVQNIATIIAALVIAFTANWEIALVVAAIVPLLAVQTFMQVKSLKGFSSDAKAMYEEASQVANDAVSSIRTVASYCAEHRVLNLYSQKCKIPVKSGVQQGILGGIGLAVSTFVMFSAYALCFWFGAKLVHQGKTTFKDVFRVFFAAIASAISISQSTGLAPDIAKVKAAAISVFGLLDRKSKIDSSDFSGRILASINGNIEFKHVSFTYPTRPDIHIFKDLCLTVHAGMMTALVGESGSGKSTVISLLERFYDPDLGYIVLDGVDIKKLQLKWLRQQIGMVNQEPVLFDDTIRANIAYGKDDAISDEQLIAAAEASNAHKFISILPDGYNTRVGERGLQLSGGQKQRVAIARAIIKNPKILLLDEATSALDAESEHIVQEALDKVMVGRTTVVIAHRLSTIRNADKIAVIKGGKIVEEGRHDELISIRDGAYAALVKFHRAAST